MQALPLRLRPDTDLRQALEACLEEHRCRAAIVIAGIGSLARTCT